MEVVGRVDNLTPVHGYYDACPIADQKGRGVSPRLAGGSNTVSSTHQVDLLPFLPMSKDLWGEIGV